jgi:hypothetical protein
MPEPHNPADKNAILVYREGDCLNDLGYIQRSDAKTIAPLMRRGLPLFARVEDFWIGDSTILVTYEIRRADPEINERREHLKEARPDKGTPLQCPTQRRINRNRGRRGPLAGTKAGRRPGHGL